MRRGLRFWIMAGTALLCSMATRIGAAPFLYLGDGAPDRVVVVDAADDTVAASVPLAGNPFSPNVLAVLPDGSRVYVGNTNGISIIDARNNTVIATIPFVAGSRAIMNTSGTRLYVLGGSGIGVIDTTTNTVTANIPISTIIWDFALAPSEGFLYVAKDSSNDLSIVDTTTNTVTGTIATAGQAYAVAFNPTLPRAYAGTAGGLRVIDTSTHTTVTTVGFNAGRAVAVHPSGSTVYATPTIGNGVDVIDAATNSITTTVSVGTNPRRMALNPSASRLYVEVIGNTVQVIDTAAPAVIASIPLPTGPVVGFAFDATGAQVYVGVTNGGGLLVVDASTSMVLDTIAIGSLQTLLLGPPCPAACDDLNPCTDDTCEVDGDCTHTPNSDPCDDQSACTTPDTCSGGACVGTPVVTCDPCLVCNPTSAVCEARTATSCGGAYQGKAAFQLKDSADDAKDSIKWKWLGNDSVDKVDFGSPLSTTGFRLCVYDNAGATPALRLSAGVPAGGTCGTKPCWSEKTLGFKYANKEATPNGLQKLTLVSGAFAKAKISVKGRGLNLPDLPGMPLATPVRVRMQRDDEPAICWEASYTTPSKNEDGIFSAK